MFINCALCLVFLAAVASSVDISTIFTICKEPNRNKCLKGAIQDAFRKLTKGNKELNIPIAEPVLIDSIVIPAGPGTVHVEQIYKNIKVHNILKSSEVRDVKGTITPDGFNVFTDLFAPQYRMEADYTLNGRILLLPITGTGSCVILLDDIETKIQMSGETFEKDGKTFAKVNNVTVQLIPTKVSMKFDNLFNGDKQLGEAMNKVINENWQAVFQDVKIGYQDMFAAEILKVASIIYNNVEYNSIYP